MTFNSTVLPEANWLKGKKVLITGATSGIGKALALLLNDNGTNVIAHGRSGERLTALVKEATQMNISTVMGDLKNDEGRKAIETEINEKQPDVLVLNAGYNCRKDFTDGWKDDEVTEMMQVNLLSSIFLARTFARLPKKKESRRLVFILSTSCHNPRERMSLYIAAKMGLMGLGKALQQESNALGIRTTLFYPGRTDTNFRKNPVPEYMKPESAAYACASILCLPDDIVPFEFTFRPESDINI
jgi:short-subunit dehydrogenase